MESKRPERKSILGLFNTLIQKTFAFCFQSFYIILLLAIFIFTLYGIYLGVYINNHLDDPITYTPYPIQTQPPDELTTRQFFTGVDAYYDSLVQNKSSEDLDIARAILKEHSFTIQQMLLSPLLVGSIAKDTVATIFPESMISEHMGQKDFHQHVEPLLGKYNGIKDLPEVLLLQIQANYWYIFGNEFNDYYQTFGLPNMPD